MSSESSFRKLTRREFIRLAAGAAGITVLASCAPATPAPPAATQPPATQPPATQPPATQPPVPTKPPVATQAPAATAPPTPATAQPRRGGTLTEGWYQTQTTWDPWNFATSEQQKNYKRVYSTLVNVLTDLTIGPNLAKSWEISTDAKTFTFHLQEKATWHDGEPVTAADVKFTFERAALPASTSRWAPNGPTIEGGKDYIDGKAKEITGIKVLDDHTVQFVSTVPNAAFLSALFNQQVAPKHIFEQIAVADVPKSKYATSAPIGSGPWKVVSYVADQLIQLQRHPGYFIEGLPYLDNYNVRIFQNAPAMVAALEAQQIDVCVLDPTDVARISKIAYLQVLQVPKRGPQIIIFNNNLAPWKNPDVRRAIAYAMDLQGLCATAFLGACLPEAHTFPQRWTWSPNAAKYPYDKQKAKSMLTQAGFDFNKQYKMITYYTSADPVAIQAMLADIGVNVQLQAMDTPAYLAERVKDTWDLQYAGNFGSADPNDVADSVSTCGTETTNFLRYCNPKVADLLTRGRTIADFTERQKVYQQADEILQQELPWIPLITGTEPAAYNKRLANVTFNRNWYDFAEKWYVS